MADTPKLDLERVRQAIDVIARAWAPALPRAVNPDAHRLLYEGCNCAGEDDDTGEPLGCNCAETCTCDSCEHQRHVTSGRCRARIARGDLLVVACGEPTRFRVRGYCVHRGGVLRTADPGDLLATPNGTVVLGDSIQWHEPTYACSTGHARLLMNADREYRAKFDPDSLLHVDHTFYEITPFRYQPDHLDVPGPLHTVVAQLRSAQWAALMVVESEFFPEKRVGHRRNVETLLRSVADALQLTAEYIDYRDKAEAEED